MSNNYPVEAALMGDQWQCDRCGRVLAGKAASCDCTRPPAEGASLAGPSGDVLTITNNGDSNAYLTFSAAPNNTVEFNPGPKTLGRITDAVLARLDWLLKLSPGERAFVQAAADDPSDRTTQLVYSDWLKEQGREADGAAMAQGWKGRLVDLAAAYGDARSMAMHRAERDDPGGVEKYHEAAEKAMAGILKLLALPEKPS